MTNTLRCSWSVKKGWRSLSAGFNHYLKGKFLFFGPQWEMLAHLAEEEILHHGFPLATIPMKPRGASYVLCIFDVDRSRTGELRKRFEEDYEDGEIVFRGWKYSDGITWKGGNLTREQFLHAQEAARRARPARPSGDLQLGRRRGSTSVPAPHSFLPPDEALFGPHPPEIALGLDPEPVF